ncbi:MAG: pseudouridine synthase [Lachnospiraceae bacterium]
MRLDKYLALASVGTRKVVRDYIFQGKIRVNGQVIVEPYYEIQEETDTVTYLLKTIGEAKKICYEFYKPAGCITARNDKNEKTVFDYFQDVDTTGLFPVGRLDKDTEGLLLITNDGEFNHQLMYPDQHIEKTYYFWVAGVINEAGIRCIEQGLPIGAGIVTKPGKIKIAEQGLYCELYHTMQEDGCKKTTKDLLKQHVTSGYITITEGRKHQIKRMFKQIGCYVVYLRRTAIGSLQLDEHLKKGEYRLLSEDALKIGTGLVK